MNFCVGFKRTRINGSRPVTAAQIDYERNEPYHYRFAPASYGDRFDNHRINSRCDVDRDQVGRAFHAGDRTKC